jgi:hypothetical protein
VALGGQSGFGGSGTTTDPRVADGMSPQTEISGLAGEQEFALTITQGAHFTLIKG